VGFGCAKISDTIFSGQSLLLNTTALHDNLGSPNFINKCVDYAKYIQYSPLQSHMHYPVKIVTNNSPQPA